MISACSVFLQAGNMIQWKSPSLSLYIWQFLCARALLKSRWVLSHRPSITMLRSIKPHFVWESHSNGTAICGKQELRFRSYKAWLVTFQMTSTFAPWRCTGLQRRKQNFCTMSKYFVCVCVWLCARFNAHLLTCYFRRGIPFYFNVIQPTSLSKVAKNASFMILNIVLFLKQTVHSLLALPE